jgi:diguanylate cyclase
MAGASAVRVAGEGENPKRLYDRIGAFLFDQRLLPEPANFTFAYQLLSDPNGDLARAVAALTDGGVRLTARDIETLGVDFKPAAGGNAAKEKADGLVAQTQMQVEGFEDMVHAMRAETEGFGRELAASAEEMSRTAGVDPAAGSEIVRITGVMLERVHTAESRLEAVTREASDLRAKLEEARDNARRDPLTDLPNRRAFEEAYAAQTAAGEDICMAVCDVDHFKLVNDRFGHAVGDRVLKAIGDALSMACTGHLVTRYGGEEFAILFTGADQAAARVILDTARASVATRNYKLRESDAPLGEVTFSAGLTHARADEMCSTVFQRADALLYAAKEAGRNCVRSDA